VADLETDVVVIGGGATGTAVLRDLALRGIDAVLVERGDLGTGTSGRWHGLLHSGGRYVVKDPHAATECIEENRILREIVPHCIEETGGLFVLLPEFDQDYGDRFVEGCKKTGVPVEELSRKEALAREPALNPDLTRAFLVPDGTFDAWKMMGAFTSEAMDRGSKVLLRHPVIGFELNDDGGVNAVRVRDEVGGTEKLIGCQWVVSAAGAWAGQIAALAGNPIKMAPGKGSMVVMVGRYVRGPVNMCVMPGDGDIIVPVHEVAILGTTDETTDDPDDISVDPKDVDFMIDSGAKLVPSIARGRVLRSFSGSRPLYKGEDSGGDSRDITRGFFVIHHGDRDGPANLISIVGGKLTTCRQMAEKAVDQLMDRMGRDIPCTTATTPLPGAEHGLHELKDPLAEIERDKAYGELICECELVTRERVVAAIDDGFTELDDLRRKIRLGYGPCQAAFCGWRGAAIVHERRPDAGEPLANLERFLEERWRGQRVSTWGGGAVQLMLNQSIYRSTFALGAGETEAAGRVAVAVEPGQVDEQVVPEAAAVEERASAPSTPADRQSNEPARQTADEGSAAGPPQVGRADVGQTNAGTSQTGADVRGKDNGKGKGA
jgi:glycerol-3-phosphate dehydrogenase